MYTAPPRVSLYTIISVCKQHYFNNLEDSNPILFLEILSLDDVVPSRDLRMENEQDQGWAGLDHVQERIELEQIQGRVELEQVQGQVNLDQIQGRRVGYNQDQSRNEDEQDLVRVEQEQNQGRVKLEQDPGRVGFDQGQGQIQDEQDLGQVEDEVDGLNLHHDEEWIKVQLNTVTL